MSKGDLTLGWAVTANHEPKYWLKKNPSPGEQSIEDLVQVDAGNLATHTIIIAPSGSGKSFFLGRLVEEIIIQTRARCLILDPNGDFFKVSQIDETLWKNPQYDRNNRTGKLPTESNCAEFKEKWSDVTKRVRSARDEGSIAKDEDGVPQSLDVWWPSMTSDFLSEGLDSFSDRAIVAERFASANVWNYYFSKAYQFLAEGIITKGLRIPEVGEARLEVIDLVSVTSKESRGLVVNSILDAEWTRSREEWRSTMKTSPENDRRVPTFIVLDEAHNLIPTETRSKSEKSVLEQFRSIASEGRKYGLFLILVTQRPDKIDPRILSECENKALLRMFSTEQLRITGSSLGADRGLSKEMGRCLKFPTGCVMIEGKWAKYRTKVFYSAARRTVEGGRGLRRDYWAGPMQ
ncbi:MAG: ATP-binding protein [Nitrososphaerota archaeon]|nr:ATP-binding protein [Nitrososphaerota archaeon]